MSSIAIPFTFLWIVCAADDYYFRPKNYTRTTPMGIAAYRSALTLDWLAAEDSRQRELVAAFETEPAPPARAIPTDCIAYPRPTTRKVARLMLELLKNLEGDDGVVITEFTQALIRTKLLVLETSVFDAEPDLDALVKTPNVMMGEPHSTFPRILGMVWMTVTDPLAKKRGWCAIDKVTRYVLGARPSEIARHMRTLDPVLARARFIMEEFIQHVTPLNMLQKTTSNRPAKKKKLPMLDKKFHVANAPVVPKRKSKSRNRPEIIGMQNPARRNLLQTNSSSIITTTTTMARTTTVDLFADDIALLMGSGQTPRACSMILSFVWFLL